MKTGAIRGSRCPTNGSISINTFVCLLRGINVGGHKKIPMQELRDLCESIGLENVTSYVQSGNLVVDSTEGDEESIALKVRSAIQDRFGFDVPTVVRTSEAMRRVVASNPLVGDGEIEDRLYHVLFLSGKPRSRRLDEIADFDSKPDRFIVQGRHVYLHCPNGVARTKLTNTFFEKRLGVTATARNWRTVNALFDILERR